MSTQPKVEGAAFRKLKAVETLVVPPIGSMPRVAGVTSTGKGVSLLVREREEIW